MPGRTPAEAVNAFVEPLSRAVSCVTDAVINVRGGYHPSPDPHPLMLNNGAPIRLASDLSMVVWQRYRIIEEIEPRGPWTVSVVGYFYSLENAARQEIISYQWHPDGFSPITFPHLHLGPGSRVGHARLGRAHLPTGRIPVQTFLRLIITDFGVVPPRRADWGEVLTETQAAFTDWGWS